jgi:hypothetical protein
MSPAPTTTPQLAAGVDYLTETSVTCRLQRPVQVQQVAVTARRLMVATSAGSGRWPLVCATALGPAFDSSTTPAGWHSRLGRWCIPVRYTGAFVQRVLIVKRRTKN